MLRYSLSRFSRTRRKFLTFRLGGRPPDCRWWVSPHGENAGEEGGGRDGAGGGKPDGWTGEVGAKSTWGQRGGLNEEVEHNLQETDYEMVF